MALALSDDKKKVFLLVGIAGLLGIGAVLLLGTKGKDTSDTPDAPKVPVTRIADGSSASDDEGAPGAAPPVSADGGGAVGTGPVVVAAAPYRDDPFIPFFTDPPPPPPRPTPRPTPRPLPTLPPPAVIPSPVDIPAPRGGGGGGGFSPYPLPGVNSSGHRTNALVGLPSARIPRLVNVPTAPRVQIAPPSVGGGGQPALERSPNKRLAGVVIGDSVRALLEVEDVSATGGGGSGSEGGFGEGGGQTPPKTYIVQPGQEIPEEGIKVLRIERTTEAGRTRVRMVVTENGVVRYIDLREGNAQAGGGGGSAYPGGGAGGRGGFPGGAGGRGGFPGGGSGGP